MADVETVDVSISIEDDAPPGTYYIAADVCAASDCPDDEPRTSYRQTNDQNFLTKTRIEGSEQEAFTSCVAIHTVRIE